MFMWDIRQGSIEHYKFFTLSYEKVFNRNPKWGKLCLYVIILDWFIFVKGQPFEHVTVAIRVQRNYSFEVIVEDKQSYVRRPLMRNREKHTGERIFVNKQDKVNVLEHSLSFRSSPLSYLWSSYSTVSRQFKHSPIDITSNCVNYPTEQFESYKDCDEDFMRRTLPDGLVPFWMVDNISMASTSYPTDDMRNLYWMMGCK